MRWAAVPLDMALLETLNFHTVQFISRLDVSYLEAQAIVDTDKGKRLLSINCEWTNIMCEWTDCVMYKMGRRIYYG
jgi:hypothetical protein